MKKRVFIIHGWEGYSEEGWFPWLKKELEQRGFEVFVPQMPDADNPRIEKWVPFLANLVGEPDENTYFVGHSIGCQAILRYLETLENKKICGAVFVAGWFDLAEFTYLEFPEYEQDSREIAKPWIETLINFERVKKSAKKFVAIFSDNDPYVDLNNKKVFEKELGAEIIIENNKKHFRETDGVKELPIVLESILRMSK